MKNMTTNNTIFRSAIFLGVCKEKLPENHDIEIFSIEENGRMETSTNYGNDASEDRRHPSSNSLETTTQTLKSKLNGTNRNENKQDYQRYRKASFVLGNFNEKEVDSDDFDQLNKRNANSKNQTMSNNQDKSGLTSEKFVATNLTETDSSSIKTLYL